MEICNLDERNSDGGSLLDTAAKLSSGKIKESNVFQTLIPFQDLLDNKVDPFITNYSKKIAAEYLSHSHPAYNLLWLTMDSVGKKYHVWWNHNQCMFEIV